MPVAARGFGHGFAPRAVRWPEQSRLAHAGAHDDLVGVGEPLAEFAGGERVQLLVPPAQRTDVVALRGHGREQLPVAAGDELTLHEERGRRIRLLERRQQLRCHLLVRAVVEGERDARGEFAVERHGADHRVRGGGERAERVVDLRVRGGGARLEHCARGGDPRVQLAAQMLARLVRRTLVRGFRNGELLLQFAAPVRVARAVHEPAQRVGVGLHVAHAVDHARARSAESAGELIEVAGALAGFAG